MTDQSTTILSQKLIKQVKDSPDSIDFDQVMSVINSEWNYTPTQFTNGDLVNEAGTNEGSCKIFAFAQIHSLNKVETLALFGTYYREDVLTNPDGNDHMNIRSFMSNGWDSISFEKAPLKLK